MLTDIADEKLYFLCKKYGEISLKYRRKFIGLLPEVYRRELYKKKGFGSIFEFAAKLAGVSEEQVRLTLNLDKRFEDKPLLMELLVNGEVSVNKLARVASIATPENEEYLAQQAKLLPKSALDTLVRDEKQNGLLEPKHTYQSLPVHSNPSQNSENASAQIPENQTGQFSNESNIRKLAFNSLNLSEEVTKKLLELQNRGIDINNLLLEFLQERELKIAQEKEKLSAKMNATVSTNSRYIPVAIKKILKEEHGEKCSISTCRRQAEVIHHSQRFSLARNHDPKYLASLCQEHHIIAHTIDLQFHNHRPP